MTTKHLNAALPGAPLTPPALIRAQAKLAEARSALVKLEAERRDMILQISRDHNERPTPVQKAGLAAIETEIKNRERAVNDVRANVKAEQAKHRPAVQRFVRDRSDELVVEFENALKAIESVNRTIARLDDLASGVNARVPVYLRDAADSARELARRARIALDCERDVRGMPHKDAA